MGHADNGLLQLCLDVQQLILQPLPGDGIHCPERLVHQQDWGVSCQGAGYADTLLLPTGELLGKAITVPRRIQ